MKQKVSIPADEQELHINYCPTDMGQNCELYTTIPWLMKYMDKMVTKYPDTYKLVKDDQYSCTVSFPYKLIKPRAPRTMTEEQHALLSERLKEARNKT